MEHDARVEQGAIVAKITLGGAAAIASQMDASAKAAAAASPGLLLAKVVSSSAGYYTLETPDGKSLRRVNSQARQTFPADTYVSVTRTTEGIMQIIGPGASQSE